MRLLLGIDSGLTTSKAALYDLAGRELFTAGRTVPVVNPHPGWCERDMDRLWQDVADSVAEVITQAGPDCDILGVGISGHSDGAYLVDVRGRPVRPGILATDSRAAGYARAVCEGPSAEQILQLTGQVPFGASTAAVLQWLADHEPESLEKTRWALGCKDWLRLCLTGAIATDRSEASTSFTSVRTQDWSADALALYGLSSLWDRLPPILDGFQVAGSITAAAARRTGLREGTPVVAGAHDVDAAAIGTGALGERCAGVVLGTFSINQVLADKPCADRRWQARSFVHRGRWLHMASSASGVPNLDWAVQRFGPWTSHGEPDVASAIAEATEQETRHDDPFFLPFLYGSPHGAASAAAFTGLKQWHERPAVLRAVMEGVAFNHRYLMTPLTAQFGAAGAVRVCGGGARSSAFTQLLSDVLDRQVVVADAAEVGARGAALLAGVGTAVFEDLDHAGERAVRTIRTHEPSAVRAALLSERYETYLQQSETLRQPGGHGRVG